MPTINMPQKTASPLEGVLGIANTISNLTKNSNESDLSKQKTQAETLANQQAQVTNAASQAQTKALSDPNSPETALTRQTAQLGLSGLMSSGAFKDPTPLQALIEKTKDPGTSGLQLRNLMDSDPNLKQAYTLAGEKMKADAMAAATAIKGGGYSDRNLNNMSGQYDSTMKPYVQTQNDIKRLDSIFNTKDKNGNPLITSQQMGDANAAIARLYSPNHMSDATVSRTEYESAPSRFAAALQKITTDPTDIGSRQLIDHIVDQGHHLANVSNQNALAELDNLDPKIQYISEPNVQRGVQATSQSYRKRFATQYPTMGDASSSEGGGKYMPTPAEAAAELAKRKGGK